VNNGEKGQAENMVYDPNQQSSMIGNLALMKSRQNYMSKLGLGKIFLISIFKGRVTS
jgi:hypothetical protein